MSKSILHHTLYSKKNYGQYKKWNQYFFENSFVFVNNNIAKQKRNKRIYQCDYAINRILQHENQFLLMYQINNCICAYLLFYGITTSGLFVNLRVFFMTAGIYSALSNVFIQVGQPIFLFFSLIALYVSNSRLKIIVQIIFSIIIQE